MLPRKKQRSSAAAAAASSSAAASQPPLHTRLYADVLEATFDFLTFDELQSVMLVCQSWLAAVYLMRGLTAGHAVYSCSDVSALMASRLTRHVSRFESMSTLDAPRIFQIVSAMPFLRELHFEPERHADWTRALSRLQLPQTLSTVALYFPKRFRAAKINAFISMIGQHPSLREIILGFVKRVRKAVSFAPLQSLHQLESLTIIHSDDSEMTAQHLQQIRQLPVSELSLSPCTTATLLTLLQLDGPPLRWTITPTYEPIVNDAIAELLPTLPRLTELNSDCFDREELSSLAFLSQLPSLQKLDLNFMLGEVYVRESRRRRTDAQQMFRQRAPCSLHE